MRRLILGSFFVLAVAACDDDPQSVGGVVLQAPSSLTSTSLNGAIHLAWSDNAFVNAASGTFLEYRVYSTPYSLDSGLCDEQWELEGSTIAPEFIVGAVENGFARCYGVVSVSIDALESEFSPIRADTPRPDARNVLMYAYQSNSLMSGFRFWDDVNGNGSVDPLELGTVGDGNRTDIDFWVDRDMNGDFWMVPERTGTIVAFYPDPPQPIEDLTSIDVAWDVEYIGYSDLAIQASPGYGYVFQMTAADIYARYGAIRVTHVGQDYMIFDWSYQTDPGNPELAIHGGLPVADDTGIVVKRH
jgi:hypothetical protein